jgi:hypothetical protein
MIEQREMLLTLEHWGLVVSMERVLEFEVILQPSL